MGNQNTSLSFRRKKKIEKEINWKEIQPNDPEIPKPRSLHTSCFHNKKNSIIIFGGRINHSEGEVIFNDTCIYNYFTKEFSEIIPILIDTIPSPRYGHSAIMNKQEEMIIYGGTSKSNVFSEIWKFDLETEEWSEIKKIVINFFCLLYCFIHIFCFQR